MKQKKTTHANKLRQAEWTRRINAYMKKHDIRIIPKPNE